MTLETDNTLQRPEYFRANCDDIRYTNSRKYLTKLQLQLVMHSDRAYFEKSHNFINN